MNSAVKTQIKGATEIVPLKNATIEKLNEKFGTSFSDTDRLFIDQIREDRLNNEDLKMRAQSNTIENFKFSYDNRFDDIVVQRMGQNQSFFLEVLQNKDFSAAIKDYLLLSVYKELKQRV